MTIDKNPVDDYERAKAAGIYICCRKHYDEFVAYIRPQIEAEARLVIEQKNARIESCEAELEEANKRADYEKAIVDRIWSIFGPPTYEELKGRSIYDLIIETIKRADAAESVATEYPVIGAGISVALEKLKD